MLAIALSLASAIAYGSADFFGGLASRKTGMLAVVLFSQVAGLVALVLVLPFLGGSLTLASAGVGALAGVFGAGGIGLLYRGLALGRMGVVSPITAVLAALTPVVYGIARGERPTFLAIGGMLCALIAVVLMSTSRDRTGPRENTGPFGLPPGVAEAIGSGIVLGGFYVVLSSVDRAAGLTALVPVRVGSMLTVAAVAIVARRPLAALRVTWLTIAVSGVLDMSANALFLLATRSGLLSVVAVLTSLYPGATIVLSGAILKERLAPIQWAGVGFALAGIVAIAA